MKKLYLLSLTAALALSLTACGETQTTDLSDQVIQRSSSEETQAGQQEEESKETGQQETQSAGTQEETVDESGVFSFQYEGVSITPGESFDADALPDADNIYTVPSCAVEGEDNVYGYGAFEVIAFDSGDGETVYSIYFIDPNLETPEGLAFGDDFDRVKELYGTNYTEDGTAVVYTRQNTQLSIILQEEIVVSIEYLLVL